MLYLMVWKIHNVGIWYVLPAFNTKSVGDGNILRTYFCGIIFTLVALFRFTFSEFPSWGISIYPLNFIILEDAPVIVFFVQCILFKHCCRKMEIGQKHGKTWEHTIAKSPSLLLLIFILLLFKYYLESSFPFPADKM